MPSVHERWNAGEHHPRVLWREVRQQGLPASDVQVRRLVDGWHVPSPTRGPVGDPPASEPEVVYHSTHKTRWLLMQAAADLSARGSAYVTAPTRRCPQIADAQELLGSFHALLRERALEQLRPWLERCAHAGRAELVGFAQGLRRDDAAVEAAVRSSWSQGSTEGQVDRLKLLKRQMDGRAGCDLLRRRVIHQ